MAEVVLIAGMSGAGRTVAADALEDLQWFVIDNLPPEMISGVVELPTSDNASYERIALVIGGRSRLTHDRIDSLSNSEAEVSLLFLEADNATLLTRYKTTKRLHPVAEEDNSLIEAIEFEREQLRPVRERADLIIDTSNLNPYELQERIAEMVGGKNRSHSDLNVTVLSFGFKRGFPYDVDLLFDVRFMPNPYWVPELKPLTGRDPFIQDYVTKPQVCQDFIDQLKQMLTSLLPAYVAEGKSYLTIAFGCTGGKHRSVSLAEIVGQHLEATDWNVSVRHRDVELD